MMSMSLADRFCVNRKGRIGGGGRVHPKGANSMAVSGLRGRKVLVGTAWESHFHHFGLINKPSCLVGPPFPWPIFQLRQVANFRET